MMLSGTHFFSHLRPTQWHNVNNKSGGSIPLRVAIKRKIDSVGNLKTFHQSNVENLRKFKWSSLTWDTIQLVFLMANLGFYDAFIEWGMPWKSGFLWADFL